jgi:N-acetylglucosamine kinase-like BadF-type ATPase
MPEYFLGVDGGQSSTYALIGDRTGRVLGWGRGGPSNHVAESEGRAKFTSAILGCLSAACAEAGLDTASIRFAACCLGFSGGPADKEGILREILASDRTLVTHDALIALSGATAGEPGLITIAGTGSIAFGRNAAGKTARAGGWGYIFGDEGGGFYIARQALRAALRFEEGWSAPTSLRSLLLAATGASDANELLHRFYTPEFSRPRIAGFAKLVDEAAENGDGIAREILVDAAEKLAALAGAVRKQLFNEVEPVRLAYIGGVFRSRVVLEHFRELTAATPPIYGPAAGALLEAYRSAGVECTLTNVPVEKT